MSKKIMAILITATIIVCLGIFSISNALALDQAINGGNLQQQTSLTSAVQLCKQAKASFAQDVAGARAKGLSSHLTQAEIDQSIRAIRDYRNSVCNAITSAVKLCREANRTYKNDVANIRARGLSLHLSQQEIQRSIKNLRDYRLKVCAESKQPPAANPPRK